MDLGVRQVVAEPRCTATESQCQEQREQAECAAAEDHRGVSPLSPSLDPKDRSLRQLLHGGQSMHALTAEVSRTTLFELLPTGTRAGVIAPEFELHGGVDEIPAPGVLYER
ncbi:hypothetical protein D3C85_1648130 [compost metagenome]